MHFHVFSNTSLYIRPYLRTIAFIAFLETRSKSFRKALLIPVPVRVFALLQEFALSVPLSDPSPTGSIRPDSLMNYSPRYPNSIPFCMEFQRSQSPIFQHLLYFLSFFMPCRQSAPFYSTHPYAYPNNIIVKALWNVFNPNGIVHPGQVLHCRNACLPQHNFSVAYADKNTCSDFG